MDQALEAQVQQRLQELPEEIRLAVQSADLDTKIQVIGQKHQLHIDQIGNLEDETLLVMLGFSDPAEFMDHLVERTSVTPVQASLIAADVAHEIFMPIRESMRLWAERRKLIKDTDPTPVSTPGAPAAAASVVMPSSKPVIPTPVAAAPAPQAAPAPKAPTAAPTAAPKPAPELGAIDSMLSQKQVTTPASAAAAPSAATPPTPPTQTPIIPAADPGQPQNYKADPYREPVE